MSCDEGGEDDYEFSEDIIMGQKDGNVVVRTRSQMKSTKANDGSSGLMDDSVMVGVHRIVATFRQTTQTTLPVEGSSYPRMIL